MDQQSETRLKQELVDRRARIERALQSGPAHDLARLLRDVDAALERIDAHRFGTCEVCKTSVDDEMLQARPLMPWCLCDLSPAQQAALQRDLDLAARIQRALLPALDVASAGWTAHYRYLPAGPVSGDYCDVVASTKAPPHLDFFVGDVMGHGVAAALLMARLNALFRSLVDADLGVAELLARMNRLFQDRASENHFVTAICGRAGADGELQLCNAGHCPPFVVRRNGIDRIELPAGLPVGIESAASFSVHETVLAPGETLFLFTDGLLEARGTDGELFGEERLASALDRRRRAPSAELAAGCLQDLVQFQGTQSPGDDLTILVLQRTEPQRGTTHR